MRGAEEESGTFPFCIQKEWPRMIRAEVEGQFLFGKQKERQKRRGVKEEQEWLVFIGTQKKWPRMRVKGQGRGGQFLFDKKRQMRKGDQENRGTSLLGNPKEKLRIETKERGTFYFATNKKVRG